MLMFGETAGNGSLASCCEGPAVRAEASHDLWRFRVQEGAGKLLLLLKWLWYDECEELATEIGMYS